MKYGKLITLEGGEGAGKTTALKVVCEILRDWGVDYICTREPGGDSNSEKIREILLNSEHLHPKTELLLMFASRNEHIENIIKPNLKNGIWVISDRYVDASYAYQGSGRDLGFKTVKWFDDYIVGEVQADLTILMDIDPVIGMQRVKKRVKKRGESVDRIELESMEFFNRIAQAYRLKAKQDMQRYTIVDASKSIVDVEKQIQKALDHHKKRLL
jgi:dTMP kinase